MIACYRIQLILLLLLTFSASLLYAQQPLPPDIDPVSYSRLPPVQKRDLDEEGRRVFEMVHGEDAQGASTGPGNVSFYNIEVARAMHILNQAVRYNSVIGRRNTEIAILVVAREFDQQYEWSRHEVIARNEKMPEEIIDTIKYKRDMDGLDPEASLIIRYGREIMRDHRLSSDVFAEAVERFGHKGAFEIAAVMGDYVMAGIMLHAVDQHLPADEEPTMPVE